MSSQKKAGWGAVFSGAIANLESRLDTILADDANNAAAAHESTVVAEQGKGNRPHSSSNRLAPAPVHATASSNVSASATGSRDVSRNRVNDRLAEKLAKATAQKTSRPSTPANDVESARRSEEVNVGEDERNVAPQVEVVPIVTRDEETPAREQKEGVEEDTPSPLAHSALPINPAKVSSDSSRPSTDAPEHSTSSRPSSEVPNGTHHATKPASELQAQMEQMQVDYMKAEEQRQEEMHAYLERIDALQAKLTYLARETVAAAKEANASAGNSLEKQVADKDEKIALLMEEGDKLSKNEMKHLQTIRKLRAKAVEDEKATADLKKKLERVEKSEAELKAKIRKAEAAERQANEKTRQIAVIEKQVDELRVDRENAADLVRSLTTQLKEAKERASQAEKEAASRAAEADKGVIANLQNELEDAQIEKKLAEDRASSEIQKARDEVERQKERFRVREMEFKSEISGLESRLEAMRSRAEEASTSSGVGDGESTLKLMRQVETLQQQYTMAKGNWETIESSLNARVLALGRERDEAVKRESDIRKKAREVGARSRKAEDELESTLERIRTLEQELKSQQENSQRLEEQLKDAETQISDNKADYDRQKRLWESEISSRVEEEKQKLKRELLATNSPYSNVNSPTPSSRKTSTAIDRPGSRAGKGLLRLTSHDHLPQIPDNTRPVSGTRRTPTFPTPSSASGRALPTYSEHPSPSLSRRESMLSLDPTSMPPTPSFDIQDNLDSEDGSYPQRTIADLVSTSTAGPGTGPSVQLVERMSSLVRKLESEKATFRDELTRLSQQRDDARNEVVSLMREIEEKQSEGGKVEKLEREIKALRERYEASLEMLGEREEEVEELRGDIVELKRIYKELVEAKIGGGAGGQQA